MEQNDKSNKGGLELETVTYVFSAHKEKSMVKLPQQGIKTKIWQIVPCICASLTCIPFGLALGWPAPSYPSMISNTSFSNGSHIFITPDQSAMIAGFLMLGNTIGTPFSAVQFFGAKAEILIGNFLMLIGWLLLWQAQDIFWLLGSRIAVGLGHGFAMGQVKIYISEMCDENLKIILTKILSFYIYVGVIAMFAYGSFTNSKDTAIISLATISAVLSIIVFLPSTPKQLVKAKKMKDARKLIQFLKPNVNVNNEINKITQNITVPQQKLGLIRIFKDRRLTKNFCIFTILVFCQQFTGVPATIIYTQVLFAACNSPNPKYLAIGYVILYLFANIFGTFFSPKYNKRLILILSSLSVALTITIQIGILYLDLNTKFWNLSSVTVIYVYLFVHTLGLGVLPFTFIPELFPSSYHNLMTIFFIMFHSILALVITKLFQVLNFQYSLIEPFYLFFSVSLVAVLHITIFVPDTKSEIENKIVIDNMQTEKINKESYVI